jgi:hypothetical protein
MEERNAAGMRGGPDLVCGQASRTWRRQLGALAWAALEELALSARRDDQGWASPARIHPIATGIGTTDAAALCAIAALGRAGLLILQPVAGQQGDRGCGYRLYLPPGIELQDCPDDCDSAASGFSRCWSDNQDAPRPSTSVRGPSDPDNGRGSICKAHVVSEVDDADEQRSGATTEPAPQSRASTDGSKERP